MNTPSTSGHDVSDSTEAVVIAPTANPAYVRCDSCDGTGCGACHGVGEWVEDVPVARTANPAYVGPLSVQSPVAQRIYLDATRGQVPLQRDGSHDA